MRSCGIVRASGGIRRQPNGYPHFGVASSSFPGRKKWRGRVCFTGNLIRVCQYPGCWARGLEYWSCAEGRRPQCAESQINQTNWTLSAKINQENIIPVRQKMKWALCVWDQNEKWYCEKENSKQTNENCKQNKTNEEKIIPGVQTFRSEFKLLRWVLLNAKCGYPKSCPKSKVQNLWKSHGELLC